MIFHSSDYVAEDGKVKCTSCHKVVPLLQAESCVCCDKFVCKTCATYRRQGNPYGYVCKRCYIQLKSQK